MKAVATVFAAVAISATLLPMLRLRMWWIRMFDFPRMQVALLASVALLLWVWVYGIDRPIGIYMEGALAFCVLYQGALMVPYTRIWRRQVQPASLHLSERVLSLVVANVLMTNRSADKFLRIVSESKPDLVLVVEADPWWAQQLSVLERNYPFAERCPQDNTYGMLLYSRLRLRNPEVRFLIQDDVPSIHARCLLRSGDEVELHFLHPRPPFPTEADESTERDAELLVLGKQIKNSRLPQIVAGDLNDVAWSRTTKLFQRISGLLDPRIGRGFFNTFHAMYPLLRFSLDHVFHSSDFRFRDMRVLPYFGSDHFPIFISLSYEPAASQSQPEPQADTEDLQEVHETVREARKNSTS